MNPYTPVLPSLRSLGLLDISARYNELLTPRPTPTLPPLRVPMSPRQSYHSFTQPPPVHNLAPGISGLMSQTDVGRLKLVGCNWDQIEALLVIYPPGTNYPLRTPGDVRALLVVGDAMNIFLDPNYVPKGTRCLPFRSRRD